MGHHDRRQGGSPAGAPRHAHRHGSAARPGAFRIAAERNHARGERLSGRAAAGGEPGVSGSRSRRSQAGARCAQARAPAGRARRPRRLLVQGCGGVGEIRRKARRARAHHHQMQGRYTGGPPAARRLHDRRVDRTRAGERIRSDHYDWPRCRRIAAEAMAVQNPRAVARLDSERRRFRAGGPGDRRRSQAAAGLSCRTRARGHRLGREVCNEIPAPSRPPAP